MHVGFVGTGNMGGPMATNVLKAGHQLTIFDARAEATAPLEKLGARRAPDLPTVAAAVEVTLTSLPNDAIVEEVLFGSAGTPGLVAGAQ
ncbi:MAG: 3-hydroxyisobutyrate dehydrogenase, partial [Nitrospirae bacterium]